MAATNTIINPQYKPIEPEKNDGLPIPKPVPQAQIGVTAPPAGAAVKQDEWWKTPSNTAPIGGVAQATSGLMDPTKLKDVNAASYGKQDWVVDKNQLVQDQVNNIISADSPLQQLAAISANQEMNKRGLMNSSMAITAGQKAVMESALPIAQYDAETQAKAANFNANAENAARQFNMSNEQQARLENAQQANAAEKFNAQNIQQTNISNVAQQNAAQQASNTIRQQAASGNQGESNKLLMQDLDNQFKAAISNADMASKAALQSMADQTKKDLASVEATYKQLISTTDQGAAIFKAAMQNITDIVNNPDIGTEKDPATGKSPKDVAIDNQKELLRKGLEVASAASELDLGAILDFTTP